MQKHDKVKAQLDKSQASLAKYKSQGNNYDDLNGKLRELQTIHEQSKAKRLADIQALEKQLRNIEGEKLSSDQSAKRLKALLREKDDEVRKLEANLKAQNEEMTARAESEEREARNTIEALQRGSSEEVESLRTRMWELEVALSQNEGELQESQSQVTALHRAGFRLAKSLSDAVDASEDRRLACDLAKIETRRWKAVVEQSREEERSQRMELDGLRAEKQTWRDQEDWLWDEIDSLRRMISNHAGNWQEDAAAARNECEVEDNVASSFKEVEAAQISINLQIDQMLLDDERGRTSTLERDLRNNQEELLRSLEQAKSAVATQEQSREMLEKAELRISRLDLDLRAMVEEAGSRKKEVMEMRRHDEDQKRELEALQKENRRLEDVHRSHAAQLSHLSIREEAWTAERAELLDSLYEAAAVRDAFDKLQHQMSILAGRSELFEEEASQLAAINAELASHTNPNQKIVYLDRIRRDLSEKREECIELRVERDEQRERADRLEEEVRMYRSVEVTLEERPRAKFTRVERIPSASLSASNKVPLSKSNRVLKDSRSSTMNTYDHEGQLRGKKEDTLLMKHPHLRRGHGDLQHQKAPSTSLDDDESGENTGEEGELTLQDLERNRA